MTHRYSEINQHDALYSAARAYPGGIEALAVRLSTPERRVSANVLRNKLRPGIDTHHMTFEEVSAIIECLEEARVPEAFSPLYAFCWRHNHVAVPLPEEDRPHGELLKQMLMILEGEGRLAQGINEALADDGRINDRELQRIEGDLERCLSNLVVLRDKVRARHAEAP